MRTDKSGSEVGIEYAHHLVHQGRMFGFYVEDTDLDTAEVKNTLIVTGDKEMHLVLDLEALGGQVVAEIFEDTVVSANGTEIPTSAFNRSIPATVVSKIYASPTITSDGTKFVNRRVLAFAQGNSSITSAVRGSVERVLKRNTKYLLRQTSVADNVAMTLVGVFYEV